MWDLYLAYCEAAFAERHIGDLQLVFTKPVNHRILYGEPWGDAALTASVGVIAFADA